MPHVLQPFVDRGALAGAVTLVARADGASPAEAVGFADLEARAPMRPDSLFWIASISKPITATALMMLVDEGRVAIDDPVEKHLPAFRKQAMIAYQDDSHVLLKKPPRPITVRDVLAHTSGLPFMTEPEGGKIDRLTLAEAAISYAMSPLGFAPGTKYAYSNAGTNTAGRVIEVASGMAYWDFLHSRLLGPLGMTGTTFWPSRAQLARLAKAYKPTADKTALEEIDVGQCTYPLDAPTRQPSPAGGLYSTAADLARFGRMVLRGGELDGRRYLSPEAVRAMTSNQTSEAKADYGLGWGLETKGGPGHGHGGAYATNLWIDPRRGLVSIYLVQHAGYAGEDGARILPAFMESV